MTTTTGATTATSSCASSVSTVDEQLVEALSEQVLRTQRSLLALRQQVTSGPARSDEVEWAAYGLLFHLAKEGPRRSSSLADLACVDPSTVSRQVAQLVTAGLVERQPDPDDGRASLLVATPDGQVAFAAKRRQRHELFQRVMGDWSAADVETLTTLLSRFNDDLVATTRTPAPQEFS